MRSKSTEMAKNVCVRTTCLFKSIRKDREPATVQCARRQVSLFVGVLGEMDHGAVIPGEDSGGECDGAEGIAEDVAKERTSQVSDRLGVVVVHLIDGVLRGSPGVLGKYIPAVMCSYGPEAIGYLFGFVE
jgi:hypothetical protein